MGKKKITLEEFKSEVKKLTKNEYSIIGTEYINSKTPILIKHNKCGNVYKVRRDDFLRGTRCPYCAGNKKKTIEDIIEKLFEETKGEYTLISKKYINNESPLKMKHSKCGKIFITTYTRFFNYKKSRCPHCHNESKKIKMTPEEYRDLVEKIYGNEYSILEDYKYKTYKLLTRHNICGHEWKIDPYHFIDERNGCPVCNKIAREESKYIKIIKEILDENNINYKREYKLFKNPKTNRYLRADFYLKDFNLVIEYDGKQHFKPMFNNNDKLKLQIERDLIKNKLLEEYNYNYIRIPYNINKKSDLEELILNKIKTTSSQ